MKTPVCALAAALALAACGYKGGLYLPKEQDKAGFGAVQTGLKKPVRKNAPPPPTPPPPPPPPANPPQTHTPQTPP